MERSNQNKPHQGNFNKEEKKNNYQNNRGQQPKKNNQPFVEEEKSANQEWDFFGKSSTPQNQQKKNFNKKQEGQPQRSQQNFHTRNQNPGVSSEQQQKGNFKTQDQGKFDKQKNFSKDEQNFGQNNPRYQKGGQGNFNKRPQAAKTSNMVVSKVPLITNQFKLTLHTKYEINTYAIEVLSDQPDTKQRIKELIQRLDKELKLCFMHYIHSGYNLFSPTCINEEVRFTQQINNHTYELLIRKVGKFNLDNLEQANSEKNPIQVTFLNLLIQKLMRGGSLKQIGKLPRFFRPEEKMTIEDPQLGQLEIWPGYKASSYVYNTGVFLALESMNKFFRKQSCFEKYYEMVNSKQTPAQIEEFFQDIQVMTEWGNKKFYKISKIRTDLNPIIAKFYSDEKTVSVYDYFKEKYRVELIKDQPLLEVGHRKDSILLPSQICFIESIPDALRKKKDLIAKYRKGPQDKIDSVSEVVKEISKNPELADWGISIEAKPYQFDSRALSKPFIITANSHGKEQEITDKGSFNQGILQPVVLQREKWAIVYDLGDYEEANTTNELFIQAGDKLGLLVDEPFWIEVPERSQPNVFEKYINEQIDKSIKAVVVLLPRFNYYAPIKRALDRKGVVSQLVQKSNIKKGVRNFSFGMQLASELLKQLSAKSGGDLYHITLPKLKYKHTMLIGMDVCHYGYKSIVGFCATLNDAYSKYFSQVYYQQKGKEISEREELEKAYIGAFDAYATANKANVEHIIIFRDGVGDAMRDQVRSEELSVLKQVMKAKFPITQPKVTLVIVNKRINQRFFQIQQSIKNPPAGTIVDSCMTYNGNDLNTYDFFLISQSTTQGCILPTHFFVAYDDAGLSKEALQELTYDLCYYYYNWSGSIKVPAPCQYAHKVAKYTLDIQAKPKSTENLYFL